MVEGSIIMNIQIILTDYILRFMYGEQTFQDKRLLSLEVIKKAYQEGLYFISKKDNIDEIVKNQQFKSKNIFVFAGIPTLEEAALDLTILNEMYAVKLQVPYEVLAEFSYDEENKTLRKKKVKIENLLPVKLRLVVQDKDIHYEECEYEEEVSLLNPSDCTELICHFKRGIEQYHYILVKKLEELRDQLVSFLSSKDCVSALDDVECLNQLALIYEDLQSCFKK